MTERIFSLFPHCQAVFFPDYEQIIYAVSIPPYNVSWLQLDRPVPIYIYIAVSSEQFRELTNDLQFTILESLFIFV